MGSILPAGREPYLYRTWTTFFGVAGERSLGLAKVRLAGCSVGWRILISGFRKGASLDEMLWRLVLPAFLPLKRGPNVLTQTEIIAPAGSSWLQKCSQTMVPRFLSFSNKRPVLEYQRERSSCWMPPIATTRITPATQPLQRAQQLFEKSMILTHMPPRPNTPHSISLFADGSLRSITIHIGSTKMTISSIMFVIAMPKYQVCTGRQYSLLKNLSWKAALIGEHWSRSVRTALKSHIEHSASTIMHQGRNCEWSKIRRKRSSVENLMLVMVIE